MNWRSVVISQRKTAEGPAAAALYYPNIVYGTALVVLLFEASEEQEAWFEAAAICNDLSTDATILNLTKVIIQ